MMQHNPHWWLANNLSIRSFILEGCVELLEPLRVGAGRASVSVSLSDLPVLMIKYGERNIPLIPGSTWKGVFRSRVESYLATAGKKVCGGPGDTCMDRDNLSREVEFLLRRPSEENRNKLISKLSGMCMACQIFGSQGYSSKVLFSDSYPLESFSIGRKPGIAIDRRSGSVKSGALYNVDFVEPGSAFSFRLIARNLPNYALGLIAKVIEDINSGFIKVGGFKTRGFGRVSLKLNYKTDWKVEGNVLKGFTDKEKKWYDPEDKDVSFDGTTDSLIRALASLADEWLGGGI
jgi:CRISPR-associated RAMP protein (TIGR02581 family)